MKTQQENNNEQNQSSNRQGLQNDQQGQDLRTQNTPSQGRDSSRSDQLPNTTAGQPGTQSQPGTQERSQEGSESTDSGNATPTTQSDQQSRPQSGSDEGSSDPSRKRHTPVEEPGTPDRRPNIIADENQASQSNQR